MTGVKKYRLTTTLALLRKHGACESGYRKLLRSLGAKWPQNKPINLLRVLKSNGVRDALWCLRATKQNADIPARLIAADYAESVLHYFTAHVPDDDRPAKAIQAARDFALGKITRKQLAAAGDAAWDAADAAWAAADAAWDAADAAWAAADAAWAAADAAGAEAWAAAWDAAGAAADAAWDAAGAEAWAAAWDAAWAAARAKQAKIIKARLR